MQKKVAITTLGCKINQFESAAMTEALAADGYGIVPFDSPADVYVINTCTVTARTDAESRRLIRRAQRMNPQARIVVTGCYAQVTPEKLSEMPGVTLIIGNAEKKGIADFLRGMEELPQVMVSDISTARPADILALESFAEHTRAFLQIQNGCDAFCSYCIVPYARGRSRSVPKQHVLDGIGTFTAKGYREVVLTGIHLGGYGRDLTPQSSLLELLREAEGKNLCDRIRIGSIEPTEIPDELIRFIADSTVVCPHLHIPLQSGSDSVLERMNRHYRGEFFHDLAMKLVQAIPDICIGLDVIAGFPGETDAEFDATFALIDRLPVGYLHVFPFSSRAGTAAAAMGNHLPPPVVAERARALRELSERKKSAYREGFLGKNLQVLVQSRAKGGLLEGLSRNYLPVFLPGAESLLNREVIVKITESDTTVKGEVIPSPR